MALFVKTIDIWNLTEDQLKAIQPGQYVKAGPDGPIGRFFGHGASTVVAWSARTPKGKRRAEYLNAYAKLGRETRAKGKAA